MVDSDTRPLPLASPRAALPLAALSQAAERMPGVRRGELRPGDRLLVMTKNSIYSLTALADGTFLVDGGWFNLQGRGPMRIAVNGCTAGGHALFSDFVAAPGLFLEFGNRTLTTRIRCVRRIPRREADG